MIWALLFHLVITAWITEATLRRAYASTKETER